MKKLKLDYNAGRPDCDIPIYKDLPLPMVMLQGWFNDQHDCFKLFFNDLTCDEKDHLFTNETYRDSVKAKYKELWDNGNFDRNLNPERGVHKLPNLLKYGFAYWITCVFNAVRETHNLDALMANLDTVEDAHDKFKPWFRVRRIRGLNVADAARILARYNYLKPESRPLLARGALRGAAIILDEQTHHKNIDWFEREYADETSRIALEGKAAEYIKENLNFSKKFQMEEGESWFCGEQKRWRS